jgi:hypothetical protein
MTKFIDLILSSTSNVLNGWFESEVLKETLAINAIIGTMGSVNTPRSGFLNYVINEVRGVWSYL